MKSHVHVRCFWFLPLPNPCLNLNVIHQCLNIMLNHPMQTLGIPKHFRLVGFIKVNITHMRPRPISDLEPPGIGFLPDMSRRPRPVSDLVCPGIGFLLQFHVQPSPLQRLGSFATQGKSMRIILTSSLVLVQVRPGIEVQKPKVAVATQMRMYPSG